MVNFLKKICHSIRSGLRTLKNLIDNFFSLFKISVPEFRVRKKKKKFYQNLEEVISRKLPPFEKTTDGRLLNTAQPISDTEFYVFSAGTNPTRG